jgi:hypothetical protein
MNWCALGGPPAVRVYVCACASPVCMCVCVHAALLPIGLLNYYADRVSSWCALGLTNLCVRVYRQNGEMFMWQGWVNWGGGGRARLCSVVRPLYGTLVITFREVA